MLLIGWRDSCLCVPFEVGAFGVENFQLFRIELLRLLEVAIG